MNGHPANPTPAYVQQRLAEGEGQNLEFIEAVPSYVRLGQLISAFANATGGTILIGVRANPPGVVGVNWLALQLVWDRALPQLNQIPNVVLHQVTVNESTVGVLFVPASQTVVAMISGAYLREGPQIRPMTPSEIAAKAVAPPPAAAPAAPVPPNVAHALDVLAGTVAANTQTIANLQAAYEYSQTIWGQKKTILLSFISGCITGVIGNYIFKALGN